MRQLLARLGLRSRTDARLQREMDEEIRAHLAMRQADLVGEGLTAPEARAEAARRFGDLDRATRQLYASARRAEGRATLGAGIDALRRDLRLAARAARAKPAFALLTVATFALGIGLTTAVFTILDHAVLRPLPFPEPDRLVALDSVGVSGRPFRWVSAANWIDWKERNSTLEASAIYASRRVSIATDDHSLRPVRTWGGRSSPCCSNEWSPGAASPRAKPKRRRPWW